MLQTVNKTKRIKSTRKVATNGKSHLENLSLESLIFPSYEQVQTEIIKKVGTRPDFSKELFKGNWTDQALKVLAERYLLKNKEGKTIETPEEMCWRVAWEIASANARWGSSRAKVIGIAKDYYQVIITHQFLPNSPTLMNAGAENGLQYSACFVLPVEDSLVGIFDALKYQALIHQTGGGTGFSFSRLRPRGAIVGSSHGTASGPVSFMRIFDAATNEVKQGGKRRGANMGILRVDHPDILEFIKCKEEGGITNFNISVGITDAFMEAYQEDLEYELVNPKTKLSQGKLSARMVFNEIVKEAWKTGDPGLIFLDRINRGSANPLPALGPIESTNPCGEQPLYPYDSCNLGSIFLNNFVKDRDVDWEKLSAVTQTAVRFLDDVIEINPYTIPQIRQMTLAIRRIGLGVGGWADLLVELGIPYDSDEALALGEKIMAFINQAAGEASFTLARERGPFPLWPVSIYKDGFPRRNSTVTTIAPTGTISIIAGASSGIEPLFAVAYRHIVKDKHLDRQLSFVNPKFEEVAKAQGFWSEEIKEKVANAGVVRGIEEIPVEVRRTFGTAHEIDPVWHIKMQAAFQKSTENAVSKTINLSHNATEEDVRQAYLMAWDLGCRGITVFRDGSKDTQVLNLGLNEKKKEELTAPAAAQEPIIARPFKLTGSTYRLLTPVGSAFITINEDEKGNPMEIFINVGKAGSDVAAMAEALGRTLSTSLRFGTVLTPKEKAKELAQQLSGIGGRRSIGFGPNKILSLPDAVSIALSFHYGFRINGNLTVGASLYGAGSTVVAESAPLGAPDPAADTASYTVASEAHVGDICPACGASTLVYEEGCSKCHACGHSEC